MMNSKLFLSLAALLALLLTSGCTGPGPSDGAGAAGDKVTATFVVEFPDERGEVTRTVEVEKGTNALEAMIQAFNMKTKSYAGMGEFVTSIEGAEAGSTHYWKLEVNGAYAEMGISGYTLDEDMQFGWNLEAIE